MLDGLFRFLVVSLLVFFDQFPLLPVVALIGCAAFFSASETALFSLSRFQLRQLKNKDPNKYQKIKYLLDRPAAFVATVLLGNELANMFISGLLANFYEKLEINSWQITLLNLLTAVPLILVFGEITPKIIGAKANMSLSQTLLPPFWAFYNFSFPIRVCIEMLVNLLTRGMKRRLPTTDQISEDDILHLLEEGKRKGAIHSVEQGIIENLFDIDDDKVIEVATPLTECLLVHQDESPEDVIKKINQNFSARIPVWSERRDEIVGILYAKDLLKYIKVEEKEMTIKDLMKEPLVVDANMKVEVLFRRFRQMKRHIAIIENKIGKATAIITMEDILEQVFGELWEESK